MDARAPKNDLMSGLFSKEIRAELAASFQLAITAAPTHMLPITQFTSIDKRMSPKSISNAEQTEGIPYQRYTRALALGNSASIVDEEKNHPSTII